MADIFISYAREDRERIQRLARALGESGFSVWWDRIFPTGGDINDVITAELAKARCVVVAWSAASVRSHYVRDEAQDGRDRNVLFPILLEAVTPPFGFRQIHSTDLSHWHGERDDAFEQLVADLQAALGRPPQAREPQTARASNTSLLPRWIDPSSFRKLLLPALVIVIALLSALLVPRIQAMLPWSATANVPGQEGRSYANMTQEAQYLLQALGYEVGPPDGLEGARTTKALEDFQRSQNIVVSGTADEVTMQVLRARAPKSFLKRPAP